MKKSDGRVHYVLTCKDDNTDLIYGDQLFHSEKYAMRHIGNEGDWETFQKTSRWRLQAVTLNFVDEKTTSDKSSYE